MYDFSKEHPEVLEDYKKKKSDVVELTNEEITDFVGNTGSPLMDWKDAKEKLSSIPSGREHADDFHNQILSCLTAIFYPFLIHPKKEEDANQGRKRIDITFENAARQGFFYLLHDVKKIPCPYIIIECKNYSEDPKNPEVDQLLGRFSMNRGRFGFLVCRTPTDKAILFTRCRDAALSGQGFIIPLDDADITLLLTLREMNDFTGLEKFLSDAFKKIVM